MLTFAGVCESDTLFNVFSVTKAVAATAVHLLAQRGHIDLHAPVSTYWPAFQSGNGHADKITVAHVLNHKAGLADAGADDMARCLKLILFAALSCYCTRP